MDATSSIISIGTSFIYTKFDEITWKLKSWFKYLSNIPSKSYQYLSSLFLSNGMLESYHKNIVKRDGFA